MKDPKRFDSKTIKRLLSYLNVYRGQLIVVTICILFSALASAASAMFLQTLIDDYIVPLIGITNPVFTSLITPSTGAGIGFFIFMASMISRTVPFFTVSPTLHLTSMILPGIFDLISMRSPCA